ncbi:hypothetical protein LEP1GSC060_0413 [Leptospira weilii serovar Ranarum str. ICFT]|uniref:Uncharacterized protein n=1 Tax=Leptospira weilii serovar Ranarum str. ICFT TaxID=1218598 RepID=N1WC87_9LEPT|nr:hypothetical protein LEP1GSC060_0413 [Leptospira weilii serovar Ranarum str. ICFT]
MPSICGIVDLFGGTLSFASPRHPIGSSRQRQRRGELGASDFTKRKLYGYDASQSDRSRIFIRR